MHSVMREVINGRHNVMFRRIECNVPDVDLAFWRRYPFPAGRFDPSSACETFLGRWVNHIQRRAWLILYVSKHRSVVAPGTLGFLVVNPELS